jgi:transcriptional regulator with XRE-family HTH domain
MPLKGGSQGLPFDPRVVGERFMQEREKVGMTRAELAATCGYSSEQVRRVELGEQTAGARLLAALAEAGGDVRGILLGAGQAEEISDMDAIAAAEYRDRVRREAREYSRMRADRRKKVLSDEEADLIDNYRELSSPQRVEALAMMQALKRGIPVGGGKIVIGHGGKTAGRDINIGRKKT